MRDPDFYVKNWGKEQMKIKATMPKTRKLLLMRPTQLHMKEDGDLADEPSFAFIFERPDSSMGVAGEISLRMLNEGLKELGYKIEKL